MPDISYSYIGLHIPVTKQKEVNLGLITMFLQFVNSSLCIKNVRT